MLEQIEAKIKDLAQKLEQSAANHNAMLGGMQALREIYNDAVQVANVAEVLDPALAPAITAVEDVVSEVEAVV